jgi:hypothetical protein
LLSVTLERSEDKVWSPEAIKMRLSLGRGIPIRCLAPGQQFKITFIPEMVGTVHSHGSMGTRVRWGAGIKSKTITNADGQVVAQFDSLLAPEIISAEAEVTPL